MEHNQTLEAKGPQIDTLFEYTELISEIRVLSAVKMDGIERPEDYAARLRNDYRRIGEIGLRCREILKETWYPLMQSTETYSPETIESLQCFCRELLDPPSGEDLDLFILYETSARLLKELEGTGDLNNYAEQLNTHVSVCYANVNRTSRVTIKKDICTMYKEAGLAAASKAMEILRDREKYRSMSPEGREFLLRVARFYSALYDTFYWTEESNKKRFAALETGLQLSFDPFYTDSVPDYNWELHQIRCLEHMGQLTEAGNKWHFMRDQVREIKKWMGMLELKWNENREEVSAILPEAHYALIQLRNSYYAGSIGREEYRSGLHELFRRFSNFEYDMYSVQMNLLLPVEYLSTIEREELTEEREKDLLLLYRRIVEYLIRSVNQDAFNYLQEYLVGLINNFIEIPEMSFLDMGKYCLAALHPPTYVHSLQVAELTVCLGKHLSRLRPECFDEPFREEYYRNCGLCHDYGKIALIDSIFTYGRDLLDREFDLIRNHCLQGETWLGRFSSTRSFADAARQHHRWYDLSGGYPEEEEGPLKTVSLVIAIADSIDAATDEIGRSYSRGKDLRDVCAEIVREAGTRYAPFARDLLLEEEVLRDLERLLSEGRESNYQKVYELLHS